MSNFKAKMHQIRFRLGELTALLKPLAGFKGPTFKGMDVKGTWRERGGDTGRERFGGIERGWKRRGGRKGKRGTPKVWFTLSIFEILKNNPFLSSYCRPVVRTTTNRSFVVSGLRSINAVLTSTQKPMSCELSRSYDVKTQKNESKKRKQKSLRIRTSESSQEVGEVSLTVMYHSCDRGFKVSKTAAYSKRGQTGRVPRRFLTGETSM